MSRSEPKPLASPEVLAPAAPLFPVVRGAPGIGGSPWGGPHPCRGGRREGGTLCQMVPWFKVTAGWRELRGPPVPRRAEPGGWGAAPEQVAPGDGDLGTRCSVTPGERGGGGVPAAPAAFGIAPGDGSQAGSGDGQRIFGAPWGRPRPRCGPAAPHQTNPNPPHVHQRGRAGVPRDEPQPPSP